MELESIKVQYISQPYKAAPCIDTSSELRDERGHKKSSNINQVIEKLYVRAGVGLFHEAWSQLIFEDTNNIYFVLK